PLLRRDTIRRVHAVRGITNDVDHLWLVGLLVELEGSVSRLGDALVALGPRHLNAGARTVKLQSLESLGNLFRRRLSTLCRSSLIPGRLQAKEGLGHVVGRIGW